MPATPEPLQDITGARVLALLGDSVTTDHISPAGAIRADSPAGQWLSDQGVEQASYNSSGSRRGNHAVMIRATFATPLIRNRPAPGTDGGVHLHLTDGDAATTYDARSETRRVGKPGVCKCWSPQSGRP